MVNQQNQDASTEQGTQKPEQDAPQVVAEDANLQDNTDNTITLESSEEKGETQNETKKEKSPNDLRAEAGKISALEKERNRYSKEAAEYRKQIEENRRFLIEHYKNNPESYEKFRQFAIQSGQQDPGSYEQRYGKRSLTGEPNTTGSNNPVLQPEVIIQQAEERAYRRMKHDELQKSLSEFIKRNPELDLTQYDQYSPEYQERNRKLSTIAKVAGIHKSNNPEMSDVEAFELAYNSLPERVNRIKEQEREIGESIGRNTAYAKGSSSIGGIAGSRSDRTANQITLSKAEKRIYDRLYRKNPSIAKRYAQNIAESR